VDSIKPEAGELLTQLAFYADWPNVFSAMAVFREVFAQRPPAVAARSALAQPDVFELALFFSWEARPPQRMRKGTRLSKNMVKRLHA
jgi:hypothetical protein